MLNVNDVVLYDFLFSWEYPEHSEGLKVRPCVVVLVSDTHVFVVPISHSQGKYFPLPLSKKTRKRIGLDTEEDSWVITSEMNQIPVVNLPTKIGEFSRKLVMTMWEKIDRNHSSENLEIIPRQ